MDLKLNEAAAATMLTPKGDGSGRYRALLIKEGWGSSGYYGREVLERDGPAIFPAGTQQYLNHPSATEQMELPERKVQDWASVIVTDPVWDEAERGLVADVEVFPQWQGLLNEQFAKHVGLSIRALGVAEHGEAEGREGPIVQRLTEGISVDWVTRAGAGGKVLELIESARGQADETAQVARLWEAKYDASQMKALLAKGQAIKNDKGEPSYPIADAEDLKNAIRAVGRGSAGHDKIRAYITRRAKALGKSDQIPADWKKSTSTSESARRDGDGQELDEAGRTIGSVLEARIHTDFTVMADGMRGDGRLTRDERIGLSNAFGAALKTFTDQVEAKLPQLYTRRPWECPEDETGDDSVTDVTEADKKKTPPPFPPKPADGKATDANTNGNATDGTDDENKKAKAGKAAPDKMKEGAMPQITDEQLKQLAEAATVTTRLDEATEKLTKATELIEAQGKQITDLQAKVAESDKRDQTRDNAAAAEKLVNESLAASGLPSQAHPRVLAEATKTLPTGEDGALDTAKLDEAIKAAIQAEKTYIAELDEARGWGAPRTLGGDTQPTDGTLGDDDLEKDLNESFTRLGLSEAEAKTAARGR